MSINDLIMTDKITTEQAARMLKEWSFEEFPSNTSKFIDAAKDGSEYFTDETSTYRGIPYAGLNLGEDNHPTILITDGEEHTSPKVIDVVTTLIHTAYPDMNIVYRSSHHDDVYGDRNDRYYRVYNDICGCAPTGIKVSTFIVRLLAFSHYLYLKEERIREDEDIWVI